MKKDILQTIKVVVLGFVLSVGVSYAASWTSPTDVFPNKNKPAPINVGNTSQGIGSLYSGSLLHINGTLSSGATSLVDALAIFGDATVAGNLTVKNLVGTGDRPVCADVNGNLVIC